MNGDYVLYRVVRIHEIEAPDTCRAVQLSHNREPDLVRVLPVTHPEDKPLSALFDLALVAVQEYQIPD